MKSMTRENPAFLNNAGELPADMKRVWEEQGIVPLWQMDPSMLSGGPYESARSWRWSDLLPVIEQASYIVDPSVVERRVLQLPNPKARASAFYATSGLINATVQAIRPGETARPHRHTMNALRFILEGHTGETIVDGKPCLMTPGDLIVTPGWSWHSHRNTGDEAAIWLDVLDLALHGSLGSAKLQPGPVAETFPTFEDKLFATPGVIAVLPGADALPHSPMFRYPWAAVREALAAAPVGEDGSRRVRYINPLTGGPVLSLLDCYAIELKEGQETAPMRSSAHAICSVVEGNGVTTVDGVTLERVDWAPKDLFNVPQHAWVSYKAVGGPARLFMATNREVFRRLGLLVEEQR
jgi:gentisate 1,2-dioxygenase